ncbi:MAG: FAD-linked oxidase C-terminal domain-containing protein [Candidatus Bathyarchaeota archaeon]
MEYGRVTREILTELEGIVGPEKLFVDRESLDKYSHDEAPFPFKAFPEVVVKPKNTEQVSKILALASKDRVPVTFRGQGTGLSCGAVPLYGGILMSFENMNSILEIDERNLVAVVEPGVVLLDMRHELEKRGLFYPADPGEKSSAIGGNVNTNAGGMNGVKYGNTRSYVLGLEVVLASGKVLSLGGKTIKRSTGYELMHLVVGSEGTLAAVTKVILRLIKLPKLFITLYVPFSNLQDAIKTVPEIIGKKITPTAIEFLEREPILIAEKYLGKTMPHHDAEAYLIIRIDGDKEDELYEVGEDVSKICMSNNALDVLVADTKEAQDRIWDLRGCFYEALVKNREVDIVDTVVPLSKVADYIEQVKKISEQNLVRIIGYGHAGDGNVHLHLMKDDLSDEKWSEVRSKTMKEVYKTAVAFGGTISGEHGIGLVKKDYFTIGIGEEELKLMKGIKTLFDPKGILNPGKIFDMEKHLKSKI